MYKQREVLELFMSLSLSVCLVKTFIARHFSSQG